jgi:pyruvate-ferredoxin/flavodoxin oxidoreductase
MDTEMYSNTGGQASKSTPAGAIARFAEGGKLRQKKDLGEIAMTYGDVYVASCAMGADHIQSIKCIKEAEEFPGPSLIIGYAPCTGHNIAGGMAEHPIQQKLAVTTGYWPLYHYDPRRTAQGKNPFVLDAKKQKGDLMKFLSKENRYAQLTRENPEAAKELHESMVAYREMKLNRFRRVALSDDALLKELKKKKNKNKKN